MIGPKFYNKKDHECKFNFCMYAGPDGTQSSYNSQNQTKHDKNNKKVQKKNKAEKLWVLSMRMTQSKYKLIVIEYGAEKKTIDIKSIEQIF